MKRSSAAALIIAAVCLFTGCIAVVCVFTGYIYGDCRKTEVSSGEISVPKDSARIFLKEELEKKYGMEFEILGGSAGFMSIAEDCDVRCVEDGVEFQATVHTKDYYEVVSENYLRHKYLPQVQSDLEAYVKKYLSDFKYVEIRVNTKEMPFGTAPDLTYDELKQETYFECSVYISEEREFTNDEMEMLNEKFASSTAESYEHSDVIKSYYKEELNMNVNFRVYTVPQEIYDEMDYRLKWYEGSFAGEERILH